MSTFGLIHGGNGTGEDWQPLAVELRARGHEAVYPDMPIEDVSAGAREYAEVMVDAVLDGVDDDVIVVGHSVGGMTVPIVASMRPVARMVFLAARPPMPGQVFGEYLKTLTGPEPIPGLAIEQLDDQGRHLTPWEHARTIGYDQMPEEIAREMWARRRPQGTLLYKETCPIDVWPDVPSTVIVLLDDRAVDPDYLRVEAKRIGTTPIELSGGHWEHVIHPKETAEVLDSLTR